MKTPEELERYGIMKTPEELERYGKLLQAIADSIKESPPKIVIISTDFPSDI